jgi:hypothetical protein
LAEIIAPGRLIGSRDVDALPTPFLPTFVAQLEDAAYALGAYPKFGAQYGYHACGGRLLVFDPASMTEVELLSDGTNLNGTHHCEIDDAEAYAFCTCEAGASVTSVSIADKANPAVVQRFRGPSAGTSLSGANQCARDGKVLAVACYSRDSVAFVDITDPADMQWLGEFRGATGGTTLNQCRRVALDPANKICYYVCDSTGGGVHRFGAIDYADPAAPVELWSISSDDVASARGVYWDADHNLIWVCASGGSPFYGSFTAWDAGTPGAAAPTRVGQYLGAGGFSSEDSLTATRSAAFIERGGRRYAAIVAESPNNITVLDITDPADMARVGKRRDTTKLNQPLGIEIGPDGYAYVTSYASNGTVGTRGITKWDLHIP